MRKRSTALLVMTAALLALTGARCGGDDDPSPGAPGQRGDETPVDDFDRGVQPPGPGDLPIK